MRRLLRCIVLFLLLLAAGAAIYHAVHPDALLPPGNTSASLGLVLLEKEQGLYVLAITQDSPADKADIHPGDYLLRVDSEGVATVSQLDALIVPAKESVDVLVQRDGREMQIQLPVR